MKAHIYSNQHIFLETSSFAGSAGMGHSVIRHTVDHVFQESKCGGRRALNSVASTLLILNAHFDTYAYHDIYSSF
jgi:hypothetical protein